MQETNTLLLLLQTSSLSVSMTLFLVLVLSSFLKPDTTKAYEQVRWMLASAMLLLAIHYGMQIYFGFRALGDDVGAVINILFYSPVAYIVSYSVIRIGCGVSYQRKYIWASLFNMIIIIGCFVYGYLHYGSLHMEGALHAMGFMFFVTTVVSIIYPIKEIRRMKKKLDEEAGQKPLYFNMYMRTSTLLLDSMVILTPFIIFYTPALAIAGPLFHITLVFYIISFVSLGFKIRQLKNIIVDTDDEIKPDDIVDTQEDSETQYADRRKERIRTLLEDWRIRQGYSSSEVNSSSLALKLNIPKLQLLQYLREEEGKTFRAWLSDIRLEEAKRLIIKHPEYSNEAVAEACGLSRSHLQVKFKETTGLTINEWRESNLKNR